MPPDRVRAFPAPAIGAGVEHLAGYIPPPPPPPSPPPCSGTFRSWCSGDEGQYGAPVWPVVLWAQPASASITKTAASSVRQLLTLFGPPDSGVPIQCHSIGLDEASLSASGHTIIGPHSIIAHLDRRWGSPLVGHGHMRADAQRGGICQRPREHLKRLSERVAFQRIGGVTSHASLGTWTARSYMRLFCRTKSVANIMGTH